MATHVMTPARRAALRRAQLASAAKRRGRYFGAKSHARITRNKAIQKAGFSYKKRSAIQRQFQADVAEARRIHLGKPRSQRSQDAHRIIHAAGRHAVYGAQAAALVAVVAPKSKAADHINEAAGKGIKYGVIGGIGVAKSPHYAKGFAKGVKHGYTARRQTTKVTRNNLRNAGVGRRATHASASRVGPLALSAGTGRKNSVHGRRVRGY